jgi:hypothetical protein
MHLPVVARDVDPEVMVLLNLSRDQLDRVGEIGTVERRLHWIPDVTFDEDRPQARTGNAPCVMATLRNIAIGLLPASGHTDIAAATRHHSRNPPAQPPSSSPYDFAGASGRHPKC